MEDAILLFILAALSAVIVSIAVIVLFFALVLGIARLCGRYWYRRIIRHLFPKYRH